MSDTVALLVIVLTLGVLAFLVPFAFHRTLPLLLSTRRRPEYVTPWPEEQLPHVTVQLPIYNERNVVGRLIDAVCGLDYPARLLEVQVLDDSDDTTRWIVEERVAYWRARGLDVVHIRRDHRDGFKAGALAEGTSVAKGEYLLVLDADFIAPPDLLRDLLPPFRGHGASPVGPPESGRDLVHGSAGASPRRTLPLRTGWTVRWRPLLQLQRHRGGSGGGHASRMPGGGVPTRSPRIST